MINSPEEFVLLRESQLEEEYARSASDDAPIEVWYLVLKNYPSYAQWVAINKTIPNEIKVLLSKNQESKVRLAIAMKNTLPNEIYLTLAFDKDESIRLAIARNKNTPIKLLQKMANDEWDEIRKVVLSRLNESIF